MDINSKLAKLYKERDELDQAIVVLGQIISGRRRQPGRPLKWIQKTKAQPERPDRRGRPRKNAIE